MSRVVRPSERTFLLSLIDVLTASAAVLLSLWTWSLTSGMPFSGAFLTKQIWWFLTVPVWVVALAPTRRGAELLDIAAMLRGIARAGVALFVVYLFVFFYAGRDSLPRLMALYVFWNSVWLAVAGRLILLWALTRDQFARRLIVVGNAGPIQTALKLFEMPALRDAELVGLVTADPLPSLDAAAAVVGLPPDIERIAQERAATEVVAAFDRDVDAAILDRLLRCQESGIDVIGLEQLYEQTLRRVPVKLVSPGWLLTHFFAASGPRDASPLAKRILDLAVALPLAIAGLFVGAVAAAAILIGSGRPVFYSQIRLGRAGRRIRVVKFRTMSVDAEVDGPKWSPKGDTRITGVGRVLRRTHVDELPQLLAVIRGDMSMVGPRPERPEFVELLEREVPLYRARLTATPGLTGWAQVNQGYTDSVDDATGKLEYDLYYVRHRSLAFDVEILFNTVGRLLGWRGR